MLAAGEAPVLLIEPLTLVPSVGLALVADGISLRAHRAIMDAAAVYKRAELPAPALQRFAGPLAPNEALLWPAATPGLPHVGGPRAPGFALVSPYAVGPGARARPDVPRGVTFPLGADLAALLRYVEATGAAEVALVNSPGDDLLELLAGRGLAAYRLGPPSQIDLCAGA
jgi:hypothetical protein